MLFIRFTIGPFHPKRFRGICILLPKLDMVKQQFALEDESWMEVQELNKISHAEEIRIWPSKLKWNKNEFPKWSPAILCYLKGRFVFGFHNFPKLGFQREKYIFNRF